MSSVAVASAAAAQQQQPNIGGDRRNLVGTRVAKYFDDVLYLGTITSRNKEHGLWHVVYDDGDEEDFYKEDLKEALKLFQLQEEEGGQPTTTTTTTNETHNDTTTNEPANLDEATCRRKDDENNVNALVLGNTVADDTLDNNSGVSRSPQKVIAGGGGGGGGAAAANDDTTNNNDNNNTDHDHRNNEIIIGSRVAKYFDTTLYLGTIDRKEKQQQQQGGGEELWHVVYDDGDEEHYDLKELRGAIKLFQLETENDNHVNGNNSNNKLKENSLAESSSSSSLKMDHPSDVTDVMAAAKQQQQQQKALPNEKPTKAARKTKNKDDDDASWNDNKEEEGKEDDDSDFLVDGNTSEVEEDFHYGNDDDDKELEYTTTRRGRRKGRKPYHNSSAAMTEDPPPAVVTDANNNNLPEKSNKENDDDDNDASFSDNYNPPKTSSNAAVQVEASICSIGAGSNTSSSSGAPKAIISEEDPNDTTTATTSTNHSVGARVAKYFDTTLYSGTITATVLNEGEEQLWHVVYDDGDEEDYDSKELKESLELYKVHYCKKNNDINNTTIKRGTRKNNGKRNALMEQQQQQKEQMKIEMLSKEEASKKRKQRLLDRQAANKKRTRDNDDDEDASNDEEGRKQQPKKGKNKKRRKKKMLSESAEARKAHAEELERVRERNQWRRDHKEVSKEQQQQKVDGSTTTTEQPKRMEEGETPPNDVKKIVINKARPEAEDAVEIASKFAGPLKPHQVDGIRFMWRGLIHSIEACKKEEGRGAILAHSMGLGKSLQIITFLHTVLLEESLPLRSAIILMPKNTLYNWCDEFTVKWGAHKDLDVHVVDTGVQRTMAERLRVVKLWNENSQKKRPGVLLMSYDQFKVLVGSRPKGKQRTLLRQYLLDPGPDVAVLDEGHIIANAKTAINVAVSGMKTRRRLILTGTPLSNNLLEYHAMVGFVHGTLLSNSAEFRSRFVTPIETGQFMDASDFDVRKMKRRVHVLTRKLKPVIHRCGYEILTKSLPPKFEYVISVRLDDVQKKLYRKFLDRRKEGLEKNSFFHAWHSLQRIWNHPRAIEYAEEQRKENERRAALRKEMKCFLADDDEEDFDEESEEEEMSWHGSERAEGKKNEGDGLVLKSAAASQGGNDSEVQEKKGEGDVGLQSAANDGGTTERGQSSDSRAERAAARGKREEGSKPKEDPGNWWESILGSNWADDLASESGKFQVLRDILTNLSVGDKVAIFSQSLGVLELIEEFLQQNGGFGHSGGEEVEFCKGIDFLRIDGSTSGEKRQKFCNKMNDINDPARLILISVKAGSLGINLVGVNRVVLFDTSFNPTHDVQSIFRAYRYGQTRPVSIYRLIAAGSMEERIYRRQVEKSALFSRVVDEYQIERHFAREDVEQMVRLVEDDELEAEEAKRSKITYKDHRDAPPSDLLFATMLKEDGGRRLPRYHEHDSLLENKPEEELTEEEKKEAWAEFEDIIAGRRAEQHSTAAAAPQQYLGYQQQQTGGAQGGHFQQSAVAATPSQAMHYQQQPSSSYIPTHLSALRQQPAQTSMPSQAMHYQQQQSSSYHHQQQASSSYIPNHLSSLQQQPSQRPSQPMHHQQQNSSSYIPTHLSSLQQQPPQTSNQHFQSQMMQQRQAQLPAPPQAQFQPQWQVQQAPAPMQQHPSQGQDPPGAQPFYSQQQPTYSQQYGQVSRAETGDAYYAGSLISSGRYYVIRSIRVDLPGPLGLELGRRDSMGRILKEGGFAVIVRAKPGMYGSRCGLQEGDVFLYPGQDKMIPFDHLVGTLLKIRPVVIDVLRRKMG